MREIAYETIVEAVAGACIEACLTLSEEMVSALERALGTERDAGARERLEQLLDNGRCAREERLPLCQDTGVAVVFVQQGRDCHVTGSTNDHGGTLTDAINDGVARGYKDGYLRSSVVRDPLYGRVNTGTNTPAIVHHRWVPGEQLSLTVMAKGGGCENRSGMRLFKPTDGVDAVEAYVAEMAIGAGADACPPLIVGVGIGGTFERCCELAKRALLRRLGSRHELADYAAMEARLMERINASGVGPGGLGGDTTCLGVFIETHPCHIASLPVGVNIECHSHRHREVVL